MKTNSKTRSYERSRKISGIVFILPWLIGLAVFFIRPILSSLFYSFSEVNIDNGIVTSFVGVDQYRELLTKDTEFLPALLDAFQLLITDVPLILALSLFIALLLNQEFHGRTLARAVFFLPVIVASGIVLTLFSQDSFASGMMSENSNSALFGAYGLESMLQKMNLPGDLISGLTGVVLSLIHI